MGRRSLHLCQRRVSSALNPSNSGNLEQLALKGLSSVIYVASGMPLIWSLCAFTQMFPHFLTASKAHVENSYLTRTVLYLTYDKGLTGPRINASWLSTCSAAAFNVRLNTDCTEPNFTSLTA